MTPAPFTLACDHAPTSEEARRDPSYMGCGAQPGEPCVWARRFDGFTNPPFHTERLEAALPCQAQGEPASPDALRTLVLGSGLV